MKFKITIHYKFKFIYMKNNQIKTYYFTIRNYESIIILRKKRSFQKSTQCLKTIKNVFYIKITKVSI